MAELSVKSIVASWEIRGEITDAMADIIEKRFEDVIRYELGILSELLEKKKPHRAFGRLSRFLSFLNMAMMKRPSVQNHLEGSIAEIRKRIDQISKGMKAKEYHLTLEMPTGISVTMVI